MADVWSTAMGHELVPNEQTSGWCCDPLGLFGDRIFIRKHNKCLRSSDIDDDDYCRYYSTLLHIMYNE